MYSHFRCQHRRAVRLGSHRQRDLPPAAFKPDDEGKVPLQRDGGLQQGAQRLGLEGDGSGEDDEGSGGDWPSIIFVSSLPQHSPPC
ncbi:hypothetical protein E2562_026699 [Oryza meyeriana var. granulata]|uniref:Uncharacterized protein n=1 Tax=Oryza meyeriana var. granulata TaxID=110450 RepID=A0A6G1E371_9ORYZ|nr:hypothetical protein E2562_026699 [Oryza meyeriana var. granulata]